MIAENSSAKFSSREPMRPASAVNMLKRLSPYGSHMADGRGEQRLGDAGRHDGKIGVSANWRWPGRDHDAPDRAEEAMKGAAEPV